MNTEKVISDELQQQMYDDIKSISTLSDGRLLEINHQLNNWEWPDEIPDPEEKIFTGPIILQNPRRGNICEFVSEVLGEKAISRYHVVVRMKSMTVEEHEKWFKEESAAYRRNMGTFQFGANKKYK